MLQTFASGQSEEGWFLDCWPAWDRLQRLWQKHLQLTKWGALIDHGLDFVLSVADYYRFTGDRSTIEALYPRIQKFDGWLTNHLRPDGLLPMEGWLWTHVWIDHRGFRSESDKHCALNILYAGFLRHGIGQLARWLGDEETAASALARAEEVTRRVREVYWSPRHKLYVDNYPRLNSDNEVRIHDRTCAMALLFGLIPGNEEDATVKALAGIPTYDYGPFSPLRDAEATIGISHPVNACWRLWALGRYGRGDAVVEDLRGRWGSMRSLLENNTFSEAWQPRAVWCQCAVAPLFTLYSEVLGIQPAAPGFRDFDVRPQLGSLDWVEGSVWSPGGDIHLRAERRAGSLSLKLSVPAGLQAALVFPRDSKLAGLPPGMEVSPGPVQTTSRWKLPRSGGARVWEIALQENAR